METGIIRQMPNGEFIEVTRPLSEEARAKPEPMPLPPGRPDGSSQELVPPPGMRGGLGRIRDRLNKIVTESAPVDGHGDGQHPNGPACRGGRRAAIRVGGCSWSTGSS